MNHSDLLSESPSPGRVTKAFSMAGEDVGAIETVRREENLTSDSAALRLLLREGQKYRALRQQAERELMGRILAEELARRSKGQN